MTKLKEPASDSLPTGQKHTPGPWLFEHTHPSPTTAPSIAYIRPVSDSGQYGFEIAVLYGCADTSYAESQKANARLIATAPELLSERQQISAALGRLEWSSAEHAEELLKDFIEQFHYSEAVAKAKRGSIRRLRR